jgi:hypothetical protein
MHQDVALADFRDQGAGRGMIATARIASDTTLFTIGRESVLSIENCDLFKAIPNIFDKTASSPLIRFDERVSRSLPSNILDEDAEVVIPQAWLGLIYVLIYEHFKGHDSKWKPYLDVLPRKFDTPMFWSDNELAELQDSRLRQRIARSDADAFFEQKVVPTIRAHWHVFQPNPGIDVDDSEIISLAHRMGSTIMAYSFNMTADDDEGQSESSVTTDQSSAVEPKNVEISAEHTDGSAHDQASCVSDDHTDSDEEGSPGDVLSDESGSSSGDWVDDSDPVLGMVPLADMLNADAEFNASRLKPCLCCYLTSSRQRSTTSSPSCVWYLPERSRLASRY